MSVLQPLLLDDSMLSAISEHAATIATTTPTDDVGETRTVAVCPTYRKS